MSARVTDVTDEAAVDRLATDVAKTHASAAIHLLFNNAGTAGGGLFVTGSREEWDRTFTRSWFGVYHCTRAFLPMLIASLGRLGCGSNRRLRPTRRPGGPLRVSGREVACRYGPR